jgi:hypothetical protein
MEKNLDRLSRADAATLARVRFATTVHLVALATEAEPELRAKAYARPFSLILSAPGIPAAGICSRRGAIRSWAGGEKAPEGALPPSLALRFTSPRAAARTLGGGGGAPLPLPLGPGALAALAFFRTAAARVPAMLRDGATESALKARLLAAAALRGLVEVAASDDSLAERMAHVPDGTVALEAKGVFSIGISKSGRRIELLKAAPASPNARLSFRDAASAVAVFSGSRPAVVALGAGEVTVGGLLPLVQGLFAVLDRLGEYMAVGNEGAAR